MTADPTDLRASLTKILAGRPLPIIRQTAVKVIGLLSSPHTKVEAITNAILHDQAFTARVLRVANSVFYQRRNDKITTLSQAIMRTGYDTIRDIAIATEFADLVQKRLPQTVSLRRLLAKTFVAGHQACALAAARRLPDAETLFTNVLLESLGEFALAAYVPQVIVQIDQTIERTGLPWDEAHVRATGMTPHEVTVLVAKAMALPDDLVVPPPADERQAFVELTTSCATNIFGPESPQIVAQFAAAMTQVGQLIERAMPETEILMADAFLKAMEFGSQVELDHACFALDGTTSPLTMRHSFIGLCIERAERSSGVGSGFGV
jgi:HD-like signal output (HDOD) protein